jgi:hypothetical protein
MVAESQRDRAAAGLHRQDGGQVATKVRRDPDFREKAGRVLDLYERRWEGRRLHPGDYVISADENTQLQALLVAPAPGRPRLVEHEHRRRVTLAYLAALDVHDPQRGLFGHCRAKISNRRSTRWSPR